MKKNQRYLLLILFFAAVLVLISFKYRQNKKERESRVYALLERNSFDSSGAEWASTKQKATGLISELRQNPLSIKANLGLAALFIQEARNTGNHVYYDAAAMKHVNDVLKEDHDNFSALCYKALLYLSQHHFSEGLQIAQQAQAINPHNAFIYGLLTDGYVELGNYKGAVEMSDKMQSTKPDIRAYSRVSYLREIYGDYPGSIEAMKLAVAAGPPGVEGTEWARAQLGHLYEATGDIKMADYTYQTSLAYRPTYAYAYSGLARVAIANKEYDKAVQYYLKADSLVTDNSFKEELADLYIFQNKQDKATTLTKGIIDQLTKDGQAASDDAAIGHYSDNELALNYLKINDYDNALKHAEMEYNRRPENITVNETMAWVYYKKGDFAKAVQHMKAALKTAGKSPDLLAHAGLIYYKAGDKAAAKATLQQALASNSSFNILLKTEAAQVAQTL